MNKDIIGQKYGRLVIIEDAGFVYVGRENKKKRIYKCKCDCGKELIVKRNSLVTGHTKSCGCLEKESKKTSNLKHGLRHHPLYTLWLNMRDRCNNPNNSHYKYYGNKGIKLCDEWSNNFKTFYDWSLTNNWIKGMSIERINNEKGYEPSNCKWIKLQDQSKNRTMSIMITRNGITMCLADWCRELKVNPTTAYSRFKRGWKEEDLFKSTKSEMRGEKLD